MFHVKHFCKVPQRRNKVYHLPRETARLRTPIEHRDEDARVIGEGVVLSRGSRSSEKFMHDIKVLMAKNYIDNLSEEARKGMQKRPNKASGRPRRRSAIATSSAQTVRK